jgi:hypothetical protein
VTGETPALLRFDGFAMSWLDEILDRLASRPCCGYAADAPPAAEPTALAAMALCAHGRRAAAVAALDWLVKIQRADGSVPIDAAHDGPGWATGWAVLAWHTALTAGATPALTHAGENDATGPIAWKAAADRAVGWILAAKGLALPQSPLLGHNTSLQAWSWAEGTTSWVEPTAIQLLAMKAEGHAQHPRARDAVRLLRDRAVPSGGWNYGNTVVLGSPLRPSVQSTGLALAALAHRPEADAVVRPALAYLLRTLSATTTTASLGYALIGLAAHDRRPQDADAWLSAASARSLHDGANPYALALTALAALGDGVMG